MISILIPIKNGRADLERCLQGIAAQRTDEPVEVIAVDSGSSDGSRELARAHGARVYEIPADEFHHGATRNFAAARANGDVLVLTSQDAYAVDELWLARLVAPLARSGPRLAGVYGRQLAHDRARPPERYFLDFLYGPTSRTQQIGDDGAVSMDTTMFSNVNSAIPRELWQRFPFADDVIMSEDQEWSRRMLLTGYALRYEALAAVRHSHDYTLQAAFKRFFDSGVSASRSYTAGVGANAVLRRRALAYARGELRWLWRTGNAHWIPYAALYESTKFAGLQLGLHHERLPRGLARRFSALKGFWVEERRQLA